MIRIAAFSFTSLCLALAAFAALEAYVIAWSPGDELRWTGTSISLVEPTARAVRRGRRTLGAAGRAGPRR
jgi:hypothetical protein